ncbi:MAG: dihydroneopterin aldolase, partial [Petrimonas sp.]|nr:dihydroneopterin aldolase [Petrimonas sp.]
MQASIKLKNMQFYAYHGVLPQEKIAGNNFVVNVEFTADVSKSFETDNVADTINYAAVYDLVKAEMSVP